MRYRRQFYIQRLFNYSLPHQILDVGVTSADGRMLMFYQRTCGQEREEGGTEVGEKRHVSPSHFRDRRVYTEAIGCTADASTQVVNVDSFVSISIAKYDDLAFLQIVENLA